MGATVPQPLRVALAQINVTVGDIDGNAALVTCWMLKPQSSAAM